MPYWEDTQPRLSPDGSQVAYADEGHVWLVADRRRPAAQAARGRRPGVARRRDAARLASSAATRRGSRSSTSPTRGRAGWRRRTATSTSTATSGRRRLARPHRGRLRLHAARRPQPLARSASPTLATGAVRALTGTPRMQDRAPAWSPDGATLAYVSERSGAWALHVVGRDGERRAAAHAATAPTTASRPGIPDGDRIARHARRPQPLRPRASSTPATGAVDRARARRRLGRARSGPRRRRCVATYEDHATPPELRARRRAGARRATLLAPAPLAVRSAPHVSPEDVTFTLARRARDPRLPVPPARRVAPTGPAPAIVYPHGGPTDAYGDDWDGHAQYFVDKGYAWLARQLPRLDRLRPRVRARQPRRLGRRRTRRTASPPPTTCARSTGSTATGSAIFGASYGSYMALLSVTDDPEHRFRCAVAKYGDCDIAHVVGAGRPRGRPGPRADDGPPVDRARRLPRRLAGPPARERRARRC